MIFTWVFSKKSPKLDFHFFFQCSSFYISYLSFTFFVCTLLQSISFPVLCANFLLFCFSVALQIQQVLYLFPLVLKPKGLVSVWSTMVKSALQKGHSWKNNWNELSGGRHRESWFWSILCKCHLGLFLLSMNCGLSACNYKGLTLLSWGRIAGRCKRNFYVPAVEYNVPRSNSFLWLFICVLCWTWIKAASEIIQSFTIQYLIHGKFFVRNIMVWITAKSKTVRNTSQISSLIWKSSMGFFSCVCKMHDGS